ncbi:hypothetical protein DVH24_038966 [Malus domestica]|uniref:Uncharacterized protein n=1 Tax=Malus domestica TaxID=3750 RepID=A0A498KGM1_MALDO|nr:hypothetical protein DVH24_038966 [Malus domestica]
MNRFSRSSIFASQILRPNESKKQQLLPASQHFLAQRSSNRFFDIYKGSSDELNRGYFADMSELKKHGGKIYVANKTIVPAMAAIKFPDLEVNYSDGKVLKLPVRSNGNGNVAEANKLEVPKASLVCLSFRASSQGMINSWSAPFLDAFSDSKDVRLYEVSLIDSWFLCRSPIKKLLLRIMRKSKHHESTELKRQIVYSFGDHYYFRKELKMLNLLTGIRCQGTGLATEEESSSFLSCTKLLLEEK